MTKPKIGIIGAAGYTGGELVRLILAHPHADLTLALSRSQSGKKISDVHLDLMGYTDLKFSDQMVSELDVVFLCLPHGKSQEFVERHSLIDQPGLKIIDLSQDFRKAGEDHSFVYGLPESARKQISESRFIANPGCFATAIQMALLPLASTNKLKSSIHVTAITGSTGAGQSLSPTSHFTWRQSNISIYKAFSHQHLNEIRENLGRIQSGFEQDIHWVPMRGNFTRGILASLYFETDLSETEAQGIFADYYRDHPFTHVLANDAGQDFDLKNVVNTNNCLLKVEKFGDQLHVTSVIDNLLKGAAGQAVQNYNICSGLEESMGLRTKASVF